MASRRNFLTTATTLGTTAAFASVPITTNQIINAFLGNDSIIDGVDILKITNLIPVFPE